MKISNRYIKKSSISLIFREVEIKSTMRFHLPRVRIVTIKNKKITSLGEDVEKGAPLYSLW